MNALVAVALLTVGQCGSGGVYYSQPVYTQAYTYTAPAVVYSEPVVHYKICNEGKIYSKFYVPVKMPNGRTIKVPVINGMLPRVRTVYQGGYEHRICTYNTGVYFKGGVPQYHTATSATQTNGTNGHSLPATPMRETSPADVIRDVPQTPSRTSSNGRAVINHPPKLQEMPRRDTDQSSELDKKMVPVTPLRSTLEVREVPAPTPKRVIPKLDAPTDRVEGFGKEPYQFKTSDEPDFTREFPKYE